MSDVSEDLITSSSEDSYANSTVNSSFEQKSSRSAPNAFKIVDASQEELSESDEEDDQVAKQKTSNKSSEDSDVSCTEDATIERKSSRSAPNTLKIVDRDSADDQVAEEDTANESVVFRGHRKAAVIDSDSDSSSESGDVNSEEDEEQVPPRTLVNTTVSRLSENFGALNNDLCSTRIGDDLETIAERSVLSNVDLSSDEDVVEVGSDEEVVVAKSLFVKPLPVVKTEIKGSPRMLPIKTEPNTMKNYLTTAPVDVKPKITENVVSKETYENQQRIIRQFEADLATLSRTCRGANLAALPDKGKMLHMRLESIQGSLKLARLKLTTMVVDETLENQRQPVTWDDIKVESDTVQPKTFGQRALQTYTTQKSVTMERLELLHGSLASCPKEDTLAEDPRGLKCELMQHQKHALAWLMWRENQQPSGGILADDMGLGKTLTMISLMIKSKEAQPDRPGKENINRKDHLYEGGTLIVCPASLLKQWEAEVSKHCKRGLASVELYHGPKRETKPKYLAKYDMVVTTYTICTIENEKPSPLYRVKWRRIILDEGHQIRNHKSRMCLSTCNLEGISRWILTGTPIHNKELDMYALMKFLRCSPFDDYGIWKRWIANKDTGGYQRLQTVIASLMLRRTKAQLQEKGQLASLPERTWKIVDIKLEKDEMDVYEKVMFYSRTMFAQYLQQRANKGTYEELTSRPVMTKIQPNSEYLKIYEKLAKKRGVREVKQHEILLILLRLRQACCHPMLITKFLEREDFDEDEEMVEVNLMEELEKLNLNDNEEEDGEESPAAEGKKILNLENPVFAQEHRSSKIGSILEIIKDIVWERNEKAIIVSQWTSFLRLIGVHLAEDNIPFSQLDGTLNVQKRMTMVQEFNNKSHPTKVLLLSLTAGGVGLNLVGANHLLLIDIHWNPQLELQAQDRIYRVGQEKPVFIYKFITVDTIEQRVKQLQDYKLEIANSMLTGAKPQHTQLSLQDLRMLFNM